MNMTKGVRAVRTIWCVSISLLKMDGTQIVAGMSHSSCDPKTIIASKRASYRVRLFITSRARLNI